MNHNEYLLTQTASEAVEIAHRITKAMQFGLTEAEPGQALTNAQRIAQECVDFFACIEMLTEAGLIEMPTGGHLADYITVKKKKVRHYMRYAAEECKTLF